MIKGKKGYVEFMNEITSNWHAFLTQQGARLLDGSSVADFGQPLAPAALNAGFVAPLTELGLIEASGDEAATFLHTQLTNDVTHLAAGEARLAGYCSPKGRLL